jgi:hypothetical protein
VGAFGVAAEVDSRQYHFDEADWESTMQRLDQMTAAGIRVLYFTPKRIRTEPDQVVAIIRESLPTGAPINGLRTVPSARGATGRQSRGALVLRVLELVEVGPGIVVRVSVPVPVADLVAGALVARIVAQCLS